MTVQNIARRVTYAFLAKIGYQLVKQDCVRYDMDEDFQDIYGKCRPYTMTSVERMYALYKAVQYVVKSGIPGSLVECGVWRGGSSMVMALTLRKLGRDDVDLYLYDTYAGMVEPTDKDVELAGAPAKEMWIKQQRASHNEWAYAPLDEVQKNLKSTGYPVERVRFVKGKVEETIPSTSPGRIALLRLDTDWYGSTYHELTYLFPRLSSDGVLIIDDYGFWRGAREATDRYFSENGITLLLNRIDDTGRIAIKIGTVNAE